MGAVLSHRTDDGEKPIAFASRSLTAAEKTYAQLEKEGLAIVFGVRKFHDYLFGRKFEIRSDHKPLQCLFDENWSIPQLEFSDGHLSFLHTTMSSHTNQVISMPTLTHSADCPCLNIPQRQPHQQILCCSWTLCKHHQ